MRRRNKDGSSSNLGLTASVSYPTPHARSSDKWSNATAEERKTKGRQVDLHNVVASTENTGRLNPEWVEWLMGWPIGWTSLEPLPQENFDAWLDGMRNGDWWSVDPADVGEMTRADKTKLQKRAARIKVLGNGQVPLTAATAWQLLMEKQND